MNILMIHYKIGGTDGVSLEMDKWKTSLEKMNNNVYMLGGEINNKIVYPPLYHISKIAKDFYAYSFENKPVFENEAAYKSNIQIEVDKIKPIVIDFIDDKKIELVIVQNIWSVAMNIALAIALEEIIESRNLKVLAQHHDFFWERKAGVHYGCNFAKEIAQKYLPPTNENYKHVVINQQGHDTLLKRKNLESTIIPNVFDFNAPTWEIDSFNKDFKKDIGLREKDIIILQATRIVDRKAIELAIDLIAEVNKKKQLFVGKKIYDNRIFDSDSNFVLLLAGYDTDDSSGTYLKRLKEHAISKNVDLKVISDRVSHSRKIVNNTKTYSLWDTYVFCDLITYPSYWEGWGNQFLEGLFAKKPMVVFEYPVFITDIKNKGFDYISLGNEYKINEKTDLVYIEKSTLEKAANKVFSYLFNKDLRKVSIDSNFEIGKRFFSMESLFNQLKQILNNY